MLSQNFSKFGGSDVLEQFCGERRLLCARSKSFCGLLSIDFGTIVHLIQVISILISFLHFCPFVDSVLFAFLAEAEPDEEEAQGWLLEVLSKPWI